MSSPTQTPDAADVMQQRRDLAIRRLKAKNDFKVHLLIYPCVNTMLVVFWVVITAAAGLFSAPGAGWFPWPIFPILGWGIGLAVHGYSVYFAGQYTKEQIQREMGELARQATHLQTRVEAVPGNQHRTAAKVGKEVSRCSDQRSE